MRMFRLAGAIFLVVAAIPVTAGDAIHLKTGILNPHAVRPPATAGHFIAQFHSYPGAEVRAALERRGIRVLGYVPDSALLLSSERPPDLSGLDMAWSGRLTAAEKLSPVLAEGPPDAFLVTFYDDVPDTSARELLDLRGFTILDQPGLLPHQFVVIGPRHAALALAAADAVAYIMPPSTDLLSGLPVTACTGPLTEAGPVADFVAVGSGWPKDSGGGMSLTYTFEALSPKLDSSAQQAEIARAFNEWGNYASIAFSPGSNLSGERNIDVKFATGAHGDSYPFTDPSVLAHTFYPVPLNPEPVAGDMHLNSVEDWGIAATTDVFSVALHEAGHALGLGHSDKPSSVMYPYYHLVTGLSADDIAGIQALYGAKSASSVPPSTPSSPSAPPADPTQPTSPPPAPPSQPPAGGDTTPPSVAITSIGTSIVAVYAPSITLSGTASDNVGVTAVKWSTSAGTSGVATGTMNWAATVPLLVGTNTVTIRAYDAAGNSNWRAVTVVRH